MHLSFLHVNTESSEGRHIKELCDMLEGKKGDAIVHPRCLLDFYGHIG